MELDVSETLETMIDRFDCTCSLLLSEPHSNE